MPAITRRKVKLKGSQPLAYESIINDKKLSGGPGMSGKMQPRSPISATTSPRMIKTVIVARSFVRSSAMLCSALFLYLDSVGFLGLDG
jgi:hypothetical protein